MGRGKISLGIIVSFFAGIVVGIVICLAIGAALYYSKGDTLVTGHPERFGDMEILALEPDYLKEGEEPSRIMIIRKNKNPFLYAEENKDGKVTDVAVMGKNESIRLTIKASDKPGKWEKAIYGRTKSYTSGEKYLDIDFDGQFDVKYFHDDGGTLISKHIYLDKVWQMVESVEKGKAIIDEKTYVFSYDFGWTISE